MLVRIHNDSVEIDGYVNAIERKSKVLRSRIGSFVERICKGAFKRALEKNDDVRILLNHNWQRDLGGTKDGSLQLEEDAIGLHARAIIKDEDVIDKARAGRLVGWSFGFDDEPGGVDNTTENGMAVRDVRDMKLYEVSLLDDSKSPAYEGTLVSVRDDGKTQYYGEAMMPEKIEYRTEDDQQDKPDQQDPEPVIDYSEYEKILDEIRRM